eukprot:4332096-Pyramimonas_sp.AAC.1
MGLHQLSTSERARLQQGNASFAFTCRIIRLCIRLGTPVMLENPASSVMWYARSLSRLVHLPSARSCALDQC